MTHDELLSHVAEHAGLPGRAEAERTVGAVLPVLGERLSWPVGQALAEDLPASLAASLRDVCPHQDFNLAGSGKRRRSRPDTPGRIVP
ncbi:MAG TPA: DUF2267 domain-containing protein [Archangium sp.]|nr:DUF2267 domain-containing protein [Archangium sp.]